MSLHKWHPVIIPVLNQNVFSIRIITYDLRVSPEFLDPRLSCEPDSSTPLDGRPAHALRYIASPVLGHCSLLREAPSFLFTSCCIICKQTRGLEFNRSLCNLKLHALEGSNRLAKLSPLVCIRNSFVKCALCEAQHLSSNANTTWERELLWNENKWMAYPHSESRWQAE